MRGTNPRFNRFAPIVCGVLWVGVPLGLSEEEKSAQNQPNYLVVCNQH